MVFSSAIFLFAFLPAVFIIYRLLPGILSRNVFLAFSSLVFYAFGQLVYLPLFLASIAAEWFFMRRVGEIVKNTLRSFPQGICAY